MRNEDLAVYIRDHEAALSGAVAASMSGDERMARIARQRGLSEGDMSAQVVAFWLKAMAGDLTLGMDVALRQGLSWSMRLAAGHGLDFSPALYTEVLDAIFAAIEAGATLPADVRPSVAAYRVECEALVDEVVGGAQ